MLFCLLASLSFAQTETDAISQTDSLHLPQLPDSLHAHYRKMDTIRMEFNQEAQNLTIEYQTSISEIDRQANDIDNAIDSLERLDLPTDRYSRKADSLNHVRQQMNTRLTAKANALKAKTTGKIKNLDLPPEYNEPLQQLTANVDGFGVANGFTAIPQLKVPGYSLPRLEGFGEMSPALAVPKIETPLGDLSQVGEQVKGISGDVQEIAQGNFNDVEHLDKTLEQQATRIDGVEELQKQSGVIDGYKGQLENLKDAESAKRKAADVVKKAAVDHFSGKQEQLKAAMEKMAKIKQKHSSINSVKNLPKRPRNAMKDKPVIERLIPGVYFQYQQKNFNLFDLNPYLSYRISGRFTAGAGWNHRFAYDRNIHELNSRARIFGPRSFIDFKLGKGFMAHFESESMNTFVPSVINGNPEDGKREWVWSVMTGLKKDYKIYKNLKGTVLIQYNLFNRYFKAPYIDRLNSRIGMEYTLRRKPGNKAK